MGMYPLVFLICLLLFLLLTPLHVRLLLDATPYGGWGRLRLFWGPFPVVNRAFEISLLDFPYFTLRLGKRCIYLKSLLAPRPDAFMPPVHFKSLEGTVYMGFREEGAGTVLLTGAVWTFLKTVGGHFFEQIRLRPIACFSMNSGRIKLEGILSLYPAETVSVYLKSRKAQKEKRSEHAVR